MPGRSAARGSDVAIPAGSGGARSCTRGFPCPFRIRRWLLSPPAENRTSPGRGALFASYFLGGFECSTHVRRDGKRLDLSASTAHDRWAYEDYRRLTDVGIFTARDGVRWHRAEDGQGRYDWSTILPMLAAARRARVQVIWDLLHFGWPQGLDPFSDAFVERFTRFAREFARVLKSEASPPHFVAPVNEISFLSYAGGEAGFFNPFAHGRGDDLKRQLVRASLGACRAVRDVLPDARLVHTDPIINIVADPERPEDRLAAELHRQSQFAAWDMIAGRREPELGGEERFLDVIGVNYYVHNQWIHEGHVLVPSRPQHLPVRFMLREVYRRYRRPLFIAETGIEDYARPGWLRYMAGEARAAAGLGAPIEGICLYPIVDHPGWEDDRYCPNGLWGYADANGFRPIVSAYAEELDRQRRFMAGDPSVALPEEIPSVFDRVAAELDEKTRRSREEELPAE